MIRVDNPGLESQSNRIHRGVLISVGAHVALAIFLILKTLFFPSHPTPYVPTLRVDLVGLPDIVKKDLHKIKHTAKKPIDTVKEEKEEKKKVVKAVEKPVTPEKVPSKERMENALARIKALDRIKKSLKEKAEVDSTVVKGNIVSPGTTLEGNAREAAEPSYLDLVLGQLRSHWALPIWLARQNLSAQVLLYVDRKGQIRSLEFAKSSGNEQFDEAVRQTIRSAAPFPDLPEKEVSGILSNGILLGFPL